MIIALVVYPKGELHLLLNSYHTPFIDQLFTSCTLLAEWPLYVIAVLPLLFWKPGWTYLYLLSELTCALIVFIMKRLCNIPRPIVFFEQAGVELPLVDGVHMRSHYSFPSGHTSTFFVFTTLAALLIAYHYQCQGEDRKAMKGVVLTVILFFLPIVGGYSRIYLSQHFLSDVLGGSLIGFIIPCLMFWLFYKKHWMEKAWFNQRIFGRR